MDPLLHLNGLLPAHLNGLLLVHLNGLLLVHLKMHLLVHLNGLLLVHLNGLNLVHQPNQEPLNKLSNPNQATTPLLTPQLIRNNLRLLTQSNHNNLILSNRSHPTLNTHNLCTQSQHNHIIHTQSSNHPTVNGISSPLTLGNSNIHHPVHGSKPINQLPHGANLLAMEHFQDMQLQNLVTARVQATLLQDTIWQVMVINPAIQPNLAMIIILATLLPPAMVHHLVTVLLQPILGLSQPTGLQALAGTNLSLLHSPLPTSRIPPNHLPSLHSIHLHRKNLLLYDDRDLDL